MEKEIHLEAPKHLIAARDRATKEIRLFEFTGDMFGGNLIVEELFNSIV